MEQTKTIQGKTVEEWKKTYPLLEGIINADEVLWMNPEYGMEERMITKSEINEAADRLQRFAPYIQQAFPETQETKGIIESPVIAVPNMQKAIEKEYGMCLNHPLLLKCDNDLPISGSIKARGGIYEVLKLAEELAITHQLITRETNYQIFDSKAFKNFFSNYSISVGSTGNLGLSIGIIGAQLGFNVTVHMSSDAKEWKKDLLRSKGVEVIEHLSDYSKAVEEGRKTAEKEPNCHFIDDENSEDLFMGYAVAASRLREQLDSKGIEVNEEHPLFVYLPCGVGGGPGGITYGLKAEFGDHVHCIFAEPVNAPCFLIGQMTKHYDEVSVQDFGLSNQTDADGLAVGRASRFVGKTIEKLLCGSYTIKDERLYSFLMNLADSEGIYLEPSALAGFYGPILMNRKMNNSSMVNIQKAHHLIWATGGSMVPTDVMQSYVKKAAQY